jgi:hypothetical protein
MKKVLCCMFLVLAVSSGVRAMDENKFDCRAEWEIMAAVGTNVKMHQPLAGQYAALVIRGKAEMEQGDVEGM